MDSRKTSNHSLESNGDPNKEFSFIWYLKSMSNKQHNVQPADKPTEYDTYSSCCNSKTTLIMSKYLFLCVALEGAVEELSSPVVVERPFLHLTLLQDYPQPLERYHDYEEDSFGELRAESTLSEKFGVLFCQVSSFIISGACFLLILHLSCPSQCVWMGHLAMTAAWRVTTALTEDCVTLTEMVVTARMVGQRSSVTKVCPLCTVKHTLLFKS